jgi:hypothetical protein
MVKLTKSKAQKTTLQNPPKLEFKVWRREFEKLTRRGTSASRALNKYKGYINRETFGAPYASDTILHEETLRNIYTGTGVRYSGDENRTTRLEDLKRMRKTLASIVQELDSFTAGMRRTESPLMAIRGNGTELVGSGRALVEAFESASTIAHDLIATFKPFTPQRKRDAVDACIGLLLEIVKFAHAPVMTEDEACLLARVAMQAHGYSEEALMILDDRGEGNRRKGTVRARLDMSVIELFPKPSRLKKPH